jgi:O-antigen/teichoic acid export membrane protein
MLVNRPDGYGEMGIYNASYQWCFAILFLPHMLKKVFLPLLSNLNGEPKRKQYLKVFALNLFVTTALSLVLVVPLILFAPYIVRAYGSGFEEGVHTFRILMLTAVLMAGNSVVGQAIASKGNMWYGLLFHALWGITLVVGTFLFLQNGFGALGLALAMLIAYLFNSIWQGIYLIVILSRKRDSSRSATDR